MSWASPDSATQRNGPCPSQKTGRMQAGTKPASAIDLGQGGIERGSQEVEIPLRNAAPGARLVDFDAEEGRSAHHRRERLRSAHATQSGADDQAAGQIVAAEMLAACGGERLVGAL